jgi:hypothetical protein
MRTTNKYGEFKDEDELDSISMNENEDDSEITEGIRQYLSKAERFSARMSLALSQKHHKLKKSNRPDKRMKAYERDQKAIPSNSAASKTDQSLFEKDRDVIDQNNEIKFSITPFILMIVQK